MRYFLIAVVAVIAGGAARWQGWLLGGLVLGLAQSLVIWKLSARWTEAATFLLLTSVLLFRPQGLFRYRLRAEEGKA